MKQARIIADTSNPKLRHCPNVLPPVTSNPSKEQLQKRFLVQRFASKCSRIKRYSQHLKRWRNALKEARSNSYKKHAESKVAWLEAQIEQLEAETYPLTLKYNTLALIAQS